MRRVLSLIVVMLVCALWVNGAAVGGDEADQRVMTRSLQIVNLCRETLLPRPDFAQGSEGLMILVQDEQLLVIMRMSPLDEFSVSFFEMRKDSASYVARRLRQDDEVDVDGLCEELRTRSIQMTGAACPDLMKHYRSIESLDHALRVEEVVTLHAPLVEFRFHTSMIDVKAQWFGRSADALSNLSWYMLEAVAACVEES